VGYSEGSLQILKDGARISEEIKDERSIALFYSKLGNYHSVNGDPLLGIKYSEKGFQEAVKTEDVDLMAPMAVDLSVSYSFHGQFLKVVDTVPKVISLLEKTHKESEFFGRPFNVYPELNGWYGVSLAMLGKFDEGEAFCEKCYRFVHNIKHLPSLSMAELLYCLLFDAKGDGANIMTHSKNLIKHCEEGEVYLILHVGWLCLGRAHYHLGNLENALKHVQKALKIIKDTGIPAAMSWFYHDLSRIHLDLGELDSARTCAEKALDLSQRNHERWIEGLSWTSLGRILGKKEPTEIDRAEEYILKGIKMLEELKIKPYISRGYFFLGELYAHTGQQEKALENLKKAEEMFQEMDMDYWLGKTREVLERL
jgi:tetratricopeptide (TPR) repeat protein